MEKFAYAVVVDGMDESPFLFAREDHAQQFAGELLMRDVDVEQEDFRLYESDEELAALMARVRAGEESGGDGND